LTLWSARGTRAFLQNVICHGRFADNRITPLSCFDETVADLRFVGFAYRSTQLHADGDLFPGNAGEGGKPVLFKYFSCKMFLNIYN